MREENEEGASAGAPGSTPAVGPQPYPESPNRLKYVKRAIDFTGPGVSVDTSRLHLGRRFSMLLVLLILGAALAVAQEDHSRHEHALAGLGTLNFPTSCNASAQQRISRGAALLHSF